MAPNNAEERQRHGHRERRTHIFSDSEQIRYRHHLEPPSLAKFESKVKPGGVLIYDGYGIINPPTRKDIHVYRINAMDEANERKMAKTFNMIVLGGLLKNPSHCIHRKCGKSLVQDTSRTSSQPDSNE